MAVILCQMFVGVVIDQSLEFRWPWLAGQSHPGRLADGRLNLYAKCRGVS